MLLTGGAVLIAAFASLVNASLSQEGRLCRLLWGLLGLLLATQGVYEWLARYGMVVDEDGAVLVLCLTASLAACLLIQLEFLKDATKSLIVVSMILQAIAAITDASDLGLQVFSFAALSSWSWIADLFDLIWSPVYAVALVCVGLELSVARSSARTGNGRTNGRVVWILSNGRTGDLLQMKALAAQLGWVTLIKNVRLKSRVRINIQAIAPMLVAEAFSDNLRDPAPDLVITAEAPLTPVARWIKKRSGDRTRLVHIGRPAGNADEIDLVITSRQFPVLAEGNVLSLPAPLTEIGHLGLADWEIVRQLETLARPVTAVLVGGRSPPYQFDFDDAVQFARRCDRLVARMGGSLIMTTSPRTGVATEQGLSLLADTARFAYQWSQRRGQDNPYKAMLYVADQIVVTSDSVSMIADAVSTRKPVFVYELPQKPRLIDLLIKSLHWFRMESSIFRFLNPVFWLFRLGTLYLRSDRGEFIHGLRETGLVKEWPALGEPDLVDSAELCKQKVESLFTQSADRS